MSGPEKSKNVNQNGYKTPFKGFDSGALNYYYNCFTRDGLKSLVRNMENVIKIGAGLEAADGIVETVALKTGSKLAQAGGPIIEVAALTAIPIVLSASLRHYYKRALDKKIENNED